MLKFKLILIALLISQENKCQQTIDGSILHDGIQRQYKLYIPASYNSNNSVPLVFSFHGLTSNANFFSLSKDFFVEEDRHQISGLSQILLICLLASNGLLK